MLIRGRGPRTGAKERVVGHVAARAAARVLGAAGTAARVEGLGGGIGGGGAVAADAVRV